MKSGTSGATSGLNLYPMSAVLTSISSPAAPTCPPSAARISAVSPSLFASVSLALLKRSARTAPSLPFAAAVISAVSPFSSFASTSAPASSSEVAVLNALSCSSFPSAAHDSALLPLLSFASASQPAASRSFTPGSFPSSAARMRAVRPSSSHTASGVTPASTSA
eukprot:1189745-Prorocentrum_minimum.AAC.4